MAIKEHYFEVLDLFG